MTIIEITRDPATGHYDLRARMTEQEALALADQIVRAAETKGETPEQPEQPQQETEK